VEIKLDAYFLSVYIYLAKMPDITPPKIINKTKRMIMAGMEAIVHLIINTTIDINGIFISVIVALICFSESKSIFFS